MANQIQINPALGIKHLFFFALAALSFATARGQMLFPESYAIILDTTRHFKGSVAPSVQLRRQKNNYTEISNTADLVYRFKSHAITVANKFELTKDGDDVVLSGGFIYARYKTFYDNPLIMEYYAQYHWADVRGLQEKYAAGANVRYKFYKNVKGGLFAGAGPFLEREKWNFEGVRDDDLPPDTSPVKTDALKFNLYISSIRCITEKIEIQNAVYLQNKFTDAFNQPRLAASLGVLLSITEYIGVGFQFQTIYDYRPIVPIDKFYYNTFTQLEITF
tara:strand:+ start:10100 stop:10927 length:828 start_codon:yes stop_codon:yes gene_type:complete